MDKDKTKAQLINELKEIRQRVAVLKAFEVDKQAEKKQPVEDYHRLFKLLPIGIIVLDTDGIILYCNPAVYSRGGFSEDDVIGKYFSKIAAVCVRDIDKFARVFNSVVRTKIPKTYEAIYQRINGPTCWIEVTTSMIDMGGEQRVLVIQHDITEQRQAREQLSRLCTLSYAINRVFEEAITCETEEKLARTCLDVAREMTGSKSGFIAKIDDSGLLDTIAISSPASAACEIHRLRAMVRNMDTGGICDIVIKNKKSAIFNNPVSYPGCMGLPEGHPWLCSFLGIPLLESGNAIGEICLANKEDGYTSDDQETLEKLSVAIVEALKRKRVEIRLRELEQNYYNSLNNSPFGICIVNEEGKLLFANKAILDIYGYKSFEELIAVPIKNRYTAASYAEFKKRREKRELGQPMPSEYEISIIRKDGETRHLSVFRKEVIWNNERQFQVLYRDITRRKQIEASLHSSEEFNYIILSNSQNPVVVFNPDASIEYVNPAFEDLTGFISTEIIGRKPPFPFWIEGKDEEYLSRLEMAMRKKIKRHEQIFKKSNGEKFWVQIGLNRFEINGECKYYISNWVDLTEQKRLKENMEYYISQITRVQEDERKRIACEIHDEYVQQLSAFALEMDSVVNKTCELPEEIRSRLSGLRVKCNGVIEGLRAFSHELRPDILDQFGLVPAIETLVEELEKQHVFDIRFDISGNERRLKPDIELAVFRIVQEALRNIRKHSRATIVKMRLKYYRRSIGMLIAENGIGFKIPENMSDFAAKGKLGLLGIQERARLMNAKLNIKSRVGMGTTISLHVQDGS